MYSQTMYNAILLLSVIHVYIRVEAIAGTAVIVHGYNIVAGNPDGGLAARGGVDPGIQQNNQIFQLSISNQGGLNELSISNLNGCAGVQQSYLIHNAASYRDNLFQDVTVPDTNPPKLKASAFSGSGLYKSIQSETSANENVIVDVETECRSGIISYKDDQAAADHYSITRHFAAAVCGLPNAYDAKTYSDFLDHWGTHVILEVYTGHKEIKRYQMAKSDFFRRISKSDPQIIKEAGPYKHSGSSVIINATAFQGSTAASGISGKLLYTITIGSDQQPGVIGVKLAQISEALQDKYWTAGHVYQDMNGSCSINTVKLHLYVVKANINQAYDEFLRQQSASIPTDSQLQAPLVWPTGAYGLPMPSTDCPSGDVAWLTGWVQQDTETHNNGNDFSSNINLLKGTYNKQYIRTEFCIKTNSSRPEYGMYWPPGAYCLLRKGGACPTGFSTGQIFWDDSDSSNSNTRSGILPDGIFYKDTQIYYCCRSDGSASHGISLPTEKNFALYRYGSTCQKVVNMKADEVSVCYDSEDTSTFINSKGEYPSVSSTCTSDDRVGYVVCHYSRQTGSVIVGK